MEAPAVTLRRRRTQQTIADQFGLVLDRTEVSTTFCVVAQRFLIAPGSSAVLRFRQPPRPVAYATADLEEEPQFTIGHLKEHRVPAGLALQRRGYILKTRGLGDVVVSRFVSQTLFTGQTTELSTDRTVRSWCGIILHTRQSCELCTGIAQVQHTVGSEYRSAPGVGAFLLDVHPDTDVRVFLVGSSEIACHKVAVLQFNDGRGVCLGEVSMLIQELILQNRFMTGGNVAGEVVLAGTCFLRRTVGQTDGRRCVAGHFYVPLHMLQRLLPAADDLTVGRVVADVSPFAVLDIERGLEHNMIGVSFDAAQIFVAPCEQIAQQHHVIA